MKYRTHCITMPSAFEHTREDVEKLLDGELGKWAKMGWTYVGHIPVGGSCLALIFSQGTRSGDSSSPDAKEFLP